MRRIILRQSLFVSCGLIRLAAKQAQRLSLTYARQLVQPFDGEVPEDFWCLVVVREVGDVIQQPTEIGKTTIQAVADYLAGKQVPQQILIPCQMFMASNEPVAVETH